MSMLLVLMSERDGASKACCRAMGGAAFDVDVLAESKKCEQPGKTRSREKEKRRRKRSIQYTEEKRGSMRRGGAKGESGG